MSGPSLILESQEGESSGTSSHPGSNGLVLGQELYKPLVRLDKDSA